MPSSRPFPAKYPAGCAVCSKRISTGASIIMVGHQGTSVALHEACHGVQPVLQLIRDGKLVKKKKPKTGATAGRTRNGGKAKVVFSARHL